MRIGIITDVHNCQEQLRLVLSQLERPRIDQIITIGDTCDPFTSTEGANEVAALLEDAIAIGVWGNHDFPLCDTSTTELTARYGAELASFVKRLTPSLEFQLML